MRTILLFLVLAFVALQYKLWLGDGNLLQWHRLEEKLTLEQENNKKLAERNRAVEADILELKSGEQALEEQARYELGMVKESEVFYQFVD